jgi:hypothetical protein
MASNEHPRVELALVSTPWPQHVIGVWPVFVVGLGLLVTTAWIALLGWLVFHAVLGIIH